jgi:hypothetical protein
VKMRGLTPLHQLPAKPCCQRIEFLNRHDGGGPVALHGEDACRGRHLEDQVPIIGNGHEPVQGWSANDGIEGEVNFRNFELHVLCAEVDLRPECDWQGDGPYRVNGIRAHSGLDSEICRCLNDA